MIITGKAKKDFFQWYYKDKTYRVKIYMAQKLNSSSELVKNAYIVEWFDSVEIYLAIGIYGYTLHDKQKLIYISKKTGDTRTEATKQAIIKANELYNTRNNNQD